MIHLDNFDDKTNSRADSDISHRLFLVAKREVLVAFDEGRSMGNGKTAAARADGQTGEFRTAPSLTELHDRSSGDRCRHATGNRRVVEEEELGRSPPFGIHSAVAVVPRSSFTIPASALVADVRHRKGKGAGKDAVTRRVAAASDSGEAEVRVVLEIVRGADEGSGPGERGSFSNDAERSTLLNKLRKRNRGSSSDGGDVGGGRVVARAYLDSAFLRRSIGCQRAVVLMAVAPSEAGVPAPEQGNKESEHSRSPAIFGRLDVAGHVVSARPRRPRIRLQVLECQNLRSADMLGKSDPCVLAFWNGVEVGRTSIARDDLHPVFAATSSTFRFPLAPTRTANILNPRASLADGGSIQRDAFKGLVDWQAYNPELRLEVWDMDRDTFNRKWQKGEFLGVVTLRGPCVIAPVIEASTEQRSTMRPATSMKDETPGVLLRLDTVDRRVSKDGSGADKSIQGSSGVISIKMVVEHGTDDSEAWLSQASEMSCAATAIVIPVHAANGKSSAEGGSSSSAVGVSVPNPRSSGVSTSGLPSTGTDIQVKRPSCLVIRCLDARGLPAGCDGYCRVFWNGRQVGRTLPASFFAPDVGGTATKRGSAPASAFQRNPVWWTSRTQISPEDGNEDELAGLRNSDATAIVPLHEDPTVGGELVLEVFDGSRMNERGANNTVDVAAKHQTSPGDPIAGNDSTRVHRRHGTSGEGLETAKAVRRDMLGRPLGSVTVRREYLVRPPVGRIDLPLITPTSPSSRGSNASGASLSFSLKRHITGEDSASSTSCVSTLRQTTIVTTQHPERAKEDDDTVSTVPAASNTRGSTTNEGAQAHAPQKPIGHQIPKRSLRLLLREARLRKGLDLSGTSDPFCTIYVDRVWHSETRVCWGTLSPRWDQSVQIEVFGRRGAPAMGLGLVGHEIRVEVWDKDVIGADDFIGEVHLFLSENQDG